MTLLGGIIHVALTIAAGLSQYVVLNAQQTYSNLSDLQLCLDGSLPGYPDGTGRRVCQLQLGVYTMDGTAGHSTLTLSQSNVVLMGTVVSGRWDTTIRRTDRSVDNLVFSRSGVNNILISNLSFDGNRFVFTTSKFFPYPTFAAGCFPPNNGYTDVQLLGATNADVHADFYNAPDVALHLGADSTATDTHVWNARSTGIYLDGLNAGVLYSYVYYSGTSAVTVNHGSRIYGNQFLMNRYEQPDGVPGGQLTFSLESNTSGAYVGANIINSNMWVTPASVPIQEQYTKAWYYCPTASGLGVDGIEGYGSNHVFGNNWILQNSNSAMLFKGTSGIIISGYDNWNPGAQPSYIEGNGRGINFIRYSGLPDNTAVSLNHIRVRNNAAAGVSLEFVTGPPGFQNGACISGNNPNVSSTTSDPTYYTWNGVSSCP